MTEQETFVLADRTLESVVARISNGQWDMRMPATFARRPSGEPPTLRQIIEYHAYDDAWVPDMLAGNTMAEVGSDKYKGDLLGNDPKHAFAAMVDRACAAVSDFDDLQLTVHTSFGDYSARDYLIQITSFRGLRAHDITLVIGIDPTLPADLVEGLWDELSPVAEEWRQYGAFPPRVEVPDDASLQDRLLGLTGRNPNAA
ncbi:MAG TPA: TIGR03086 family protein [Candidatus Dormibacteraeota bacterium]|nr:TIGR03086 family protein [Candidatus Dormibacteraeota bacterium]